MHILMRAEILRSLGDVVRKVKSSCSPSTGSFFVPRMNPLQTRLADY